MPPKMAKTVKQISNDIWDSSNPQAREVFLGVLVGICSGILFGYFGKLAAVSTIGALLLISIMEKKGYLKINWNKIAEEYRKYKLKLAASAIVPRLMKFVATYKYFSMSFVGGFILGLIF